MMQTYHNSRLSEKRRGRGRGRGLKRNPQNYLRVTKLSCYIEIVLFPSSLLPIKCTKKSKLTKELSENACEEVHVTGNIVGHGKWKRFHDGVNTEYSLKKLQIQKMYYVSNSIMNGFRWPAPKGGGTLRK